MRYLQQQELVGNTPAAVATFLRDATFLDKVKIGEYLGGQYVLDPPIERAPREGGRVGAHVFRPGRCDRSYAHSDDFHLAVLESYTAQQNFDKMPFDAALRCGSPPRHPHPTPPHLAL